MPGGNGRAGTAVPPVANSLRMGDLASAEGETQNCTRKDTAVGSDLTASLAG